jgi:hypothetical protein
LTTNGTSESWGTVTTPITWTNRLVGSSNVLRAIAWNGSNIYVAAGDGGSLFSSADGITWTSRTSGFGTDQIFDVKFGNGLFVAVGGNGKITTSTDGTTWTARTSGFASLQMRKVLYANSIWVAVGDGGGTNNTGGISYSTDGLTWTRKSQTITIGPSYRDVIWNGTNWIIVSDVDNNNYIYATTPSGTWTAARSGSPDNITSILWDGTRSIFWNDANIMQQTTSTTLSSPSQLFAVGFGSAYANAKFLYSGVVYAGPRYFSRFTPSASLNPANNIISICPSSYDTGGGSLGGSRITGVLVTSAGIFITDDGGRIFTSF